ncbi:MAG: IPT/TIG domain-containing protein [bacterium]
MKNINNNLIFFALALFIFVGFGSMPKNANAYYYVGFAPNGNYIGCETDLDSNGNFVGCGNVNSNTWKDIGNSVVGNPIPSIFTISSKSVKQNTSTNITVKGTNFLTSSVIRFNNTNQPTTYVDSQTLRFQVNSAMISTVGSFPIVVANPGPGGGLSNAVSLNVTGNQVLGASGTNSTNSVNGTSNTSGSDLSANALFASGFMPSGFLGWVLVFFLILVIVIIWRKLFATEKYNSAPLKHA